MFCGESVVEMVSTDLQSALPGMSKCFPGNIWGKHWLHEMYAVPEFLAQSVREFDYCGTKQILQQPVVEFDKSQNRLQPTAKLSDARVSPFLPQLAAEIHVWGQCLVKRMR